MASGTQLDMIHDTKTVTMHVDNRDYQTIQRQSMSFNRKVDFINSNMTFPIFMAHEPS